MTSLPVRVTITESSSRDGLQSLGAFVATEAKAKLIDDLAEGGLTSFDAVSFVSPKWVPQMADGSDVIKAIQNDSVRLIGLVPNMRGLEAALEAGLTDIGVLAAASDTFSQRNINATVDEAMHRIRRIVLDSPEDLRFRAYISTATHCPYEGEQDPDWVAHLAETLVEWGVDEVFLGETIGMATPAHMNRLLDDVLDLVPLSRAGVHLHDTYGQAIAGQRVAAHVPVALDEVVRYPVHPEVPDVDRAVGDIHLTIPDGGRLPVDNRGDAPIGPQRVARPIIGVAEDDV